MALCMTISEQVSYKSKDGDEMLIDKTYNNAYLVVSNIRGDKNKMNVYIDAYPNENKNENELISRSGYIFSPALDGVNFIAQAYNFIKTLPEYKNAKDC